MTGEKPTSVTVHISILFALTYPGLDLIQDIVITWDMRNLLTHKGTPNPQM